MADIKNKLFNYLAQRHFDLMPPEVRARFDDYAKYEDFQGHMKHWYQNYKDSSTPDLANNIGTGENLTDDEWINLYEAYQEVFQRMNDAKTPDLGFASQYNKPTKDFIARWFGTDKVFVPSQAKSDIDNMLFRTPGYENNLADFLNFHKAKLKPIFTNRNNSALKDVFSSISYENFILGLQAQKYNTDTKFKEQLETVIYYIAQNMPKPGWDRPDPTEWPENVGYTSDPADPDKVGPTIDPVLRNIYDNRDTHDWFEIPNRSTHVNEFKDHYTEIFDVLLTNSTIREKFLGQATGNSIVSDPINKALELTDYGNKDSKDYVPPKYTDEKNWRQDLEDKLKDTYEDYFRKFVNPSRGTRIYFSPWSQDIIKAFDKAKVKPTDGLEGILSKKDDIAKNLKTKTPTDHFKWFTETITKLKDAGMGKAVEGALRNGKQMRHLVSGIIAEAVEQNKVKEAKTALEILSVAKYGLSSSRTFDALNKAAKDMKIFSDDKLSWNKNEGMKFVSKAVDRTAGFAIQGVGLVATAAHNFIQHHRTKIDGDITKNKILKKSYQHWDEQDLETEVKDAPQQLANLAAGLGESHMAIHAGNIAARKTLRDGMAPGPDKDNLSRDIELFERAARNNTELTAIRNRQTARDSASNPYKELVAYWNMLESVGKSHSFTLGSMSVKRKSMLADFAQGTSRAQNIASDYLSNFTSFNAPQRA